MDTTAIETKPASALAEWIRQNTRDGEQYAGILLGKNGERDQVIFLLPGETKDNWSTCMAWAASIDGDLPTRREQSLLFANLGESFKPDWYWSNTQHADDSGYAWGQGFYYGSQTGFSKSAAGRARAVRRLII